MPEGTIFGHAGSIIEGGKGRPSTKIKILRDAGVQVVDRYDGIITVLQSLHLESVQANAATPEG
jgi:succinyl-CoA synthetase alpha subunit